MLLLSVIHSISGVTKQLRSSCAFHPSIILVFHFEPTTDIISGNDIYYVNSSLAQDFKGILLTKFVCVTLPSAAIIEGSSQIFFNSDSFSLSIALATAFRK